MAIKSAKKNDTPPSAYIPDDLLTFEQILEANKVIESAEQATVPKSNGEKIDFPEGVIPPPPQEKLDSQGNVIPPEPAKVDLKGKPFNLTICIDTFIGMICMFIFKNFDSTLLDLTNDEKIYFSQLEEKCGIKFEIDSPWFYFGALSMCYMGKIKTIYMLNKMAKEEKRIEEERKKKEEKEHEIEDEEIEEIEEEEPGEPPVIIRKKRKYKKRRK